MMRPGHRTGHVIARRSRCQNALVARLRGLPLTASIVHVTVPMAALGYALAVVVVAQGGPVRITSYAQMGPPYALLDRGAGLALIVVGVYAWFGWPRSRVGGLAILCGAAWFGPDWLGAVGAPDVVRSVSLLMTPFLVPLTADLVVTATDRRGAGPGGRRLIVLLYGVTAVLTVARVVTYVPFDERYCWAICTQTGNIFAIGGGNGEATRWLTTSWLTVAAVAWCTLALWSARHLRPVSPRLHPRRRGVLVAAVMLGLAWAAYQGALMVLRDERPNPLDLRTTPFQALFLGRAAATLMLGACLAGMVRWEHRRSGAMRDVTAIIAATPAPGSLATALGRALDDDSLEVLFPVDDGAGFVDASGVPMASPRVLPGRAVTPIERGGRPIALVVHGPGIDSRTLEHEIGSAARLAVDNERLRAVVLAQVLELRTSRSRIVDVGDAERQRLERDLHDGAQQRLLALSYEIRLARSAAARAGMMPLAQRLHQADAVSLQAIEELRQLAHGIYPAILTEAGLGPALASLSDDAALPIEIDSTLSGRLPQPVEIAAYQAVTDALSAAVQRGASHLGVRLERTGDSLNVDISDDATTPMVALVRAADRVGAAGGTLATSTVPPISGSRIVVELPCG